MQGQQEGQMTGFMCTNAEGQDSMENVWRGGATWVVCVLMCARALRIKVLN